MRLNCVRVHRAHSNGLSGFSLIEVLIALILCGGLSFLFYKQQWHVTDVLHGLVLRTQALRELNNLSEHAFAHDHRYVVCEPFTLSFHSSDMAQLLWSYKKSKESMQRIMRHA